MTAPEFKQAAEMEEPNILFLSIPLKNADKLEWTDALLSYINTSYAEDASKYEEDCKIIDWMRDHFIRQSSEDPLAIENLSIYFNQLTFLGSRFPPDINLDIGWLPIFIPEGKPDVLSNINYEKTCVLFRIAGIYSQLGCSQSYISTEGIRKACQYFQNAAGCLNYIQTELLQDLRATPPPDLELLPALITLMLAQAHECIWQKAVMEHMKYGTVARLAVKVSDFYETFLNESEKLPCNDWKILGEIKFCYFKAVAQYQKANEAISSGRYGEEIARLLLARSNNEGALMKLKEFPLLHTDFVEQIHVLQQAIMKDLIRAEKDNDLVYMETVPEADQLAPILRTEMVKLILPSFVLNPNYWLTMTPRPEEDEESEMLVKRPLFETLVPFAVHQAASVYADKKDYIVKVDIIARNQELKDEYEKVMQELQLPYAVDVVDSLPRKLVECAEEIQHEGGIQSLHDMLEKIQRMSKKATMLIEEGFNVIEEENEQDALLSSQFGKLWTRPSSRSLTKNLLTMGTQYYDTIQAAQKADRIVQAKVTNWGRAITMLSKPTEEIKGQIPNLDSDSDYYLLITDLLGQLRDKMNLLEENYLERQILEERAISLAKNDDISTVLLNKSNELTKGSPIVKLEPEQFADVFEEHLRAYQTFQEQMQKHIDDQADLIYQLGNIYSQFSLVVVSINILAKREKVINNLEMAFTKFKEIRTNLVEGIKFYSNYTDTLTQFRDECIEFALSRRMEAAELSRTNSPVRLMIKK
ncbi:BRO1-like domain-containing protein [Pilobolus umbonatus]|nr:BRO1-like domain-containing protein [Pilobolus umbonatus]